MLGVPCQPKLSVDAISENCIRVLTPGRCAMPSSVRHAIQRAPDPQDAGHVVGHHLGVEPDAIDTSGDRPNAKGQN